jgi:hypothetical protein
MYVGHPGDRKRVEYLVLLRHPSTFNWFARTSARERVPSPFILRLSPLPYYNYTSRVRVGVLEDFFFLRIQNIFRHRPLNLKEVCCPWEVTYIKCQ